MRVFRNTENTPERKKRATRGFTLAEMLVVIAIIAILVGLASIAASSLLASMRQNKLDTIAQDIYVTAQERLTEMYIDNRVDDVSFQSLSAVGGSTEGLLELKADNDALKPKDWDSANIPYAGLNAMYNQQGPTAAAVLLPAGALSAEVEANHWIIEYNPEYGYIYAVYYSEKAFDPASIGSWYSSGKANLYRSYSDRKGSGVGYYGGVGVLGGKVLMTTTSLNVSLNIINAEELRADLAVRIPTEYKERPVRVKFTFTGEQSGAVSEYEVIMSALDSGYFNREYALIMDSFNRNQQFGELDLFEDMSPGENVTMEVLAELGSAGMGSFKADPALDTAMTTAVFNSLFQSIDTETGTAYVSAGRHLQNLDEDIVSAELGITNVIQTGNIDFKNTTPEEEEDAIFWWAETYCDKDGNVRTFQPVKNGSIRTFTGSSVDEENQRGYYIISGMTVEGSGGVPAGMFGVLGEAGQETTVTDVSLVGSTVTSNAGPVGALAGRTLGSVALKNTGAYLAREDYSNKTYKNAQTALSGRTVGGLIGEAQNGITADECYAAEVLRGTSRVGGLFGAVKGTMTLTNSYSDCYLCYVGAFKPDNGSAVGGFTSSCGSGSTISGCYAAGFTVGLPSQSAGFTPSAVASVSNSYSVLNIGPNLEEEATISAGYSFIPTVGGGTCENVYYVLSRSETEYGVTLKNKDRGTGLDYYQLKGSNAGKYTHLTQGTVGFRFSIVSGDTTAYNLAAGLGLTNYPYPYIRTANGVLHHYGDWDGNLFDPGTLVYFEQYADGTRGYYGAGSNFLNSNAEVVLDGYALLYSASSVEGADAFGTKRTATVSYGGTNYSVAPINKDTDKYTVQTRTITGGSGTDTYYFRDLSYDIVNSGSAAVSDFYTRITVNTNEQVSEDVSGISYYWFNPHFAATVEEVEGVGSPQPTLAGAAKNIVRIRTPRQLYLLSRYFEGHSGALVYPVILEQEMDLDYSAYHWTDADYDKAVVSQGPIGDGVNRFRATYDGKCHVITGVSFKSENLFSGLFGYVASGGKLRNVVVAAEAGAGLTVGYSKAPQQANNYAYVGTLAGYNAGVISNCAVAGYELSVDSYNTTLYAGGLVGYNTKTILNSSADIPGLTVRTNSCNAFVGSFLGANGGSGGVTQSYSLSSVQVNRYTSGTVRVGGFAGSNAGSIQNSYTATAMSVSNIQKEYLDGFAPTGGIVQGCYFLTDGTYKFTDGVYAYGQSSKTANAARGVVELRSLAPEGFGRADENNSSYHEATSEKAGDAYPFATSVKTTGGISAHYGNWISDDVFSNYGILYWEHEEKGANNGYHFYLVDDKGGQYNTLCKAHDDGGVVTEYGYGYYRLIDESVNPGIPSFTKNGKPTVDVKEEYRNSGAEADLEKQFADNYDFVLYNTSDAFADSPDGLYLIGENAYATATYGGKTFTFSPFFGATVQLDEAAPTTMQVRSIDQLQFLNWNQGGTKTVTEETYTRVGEITFEDAYKRGSKPLYYKSGDAYTAVTISRQYNYYYRDYYYYLSDNGATIDRGWSGSTVDVTLYTRSTTTQTVQENANTKQLVDVGNYQKFTYLGYARETGTGTQSREGAGNKVVFAWQWNQTHDIKLSSNVPFTPIAAAATSSTSNYDAILYAWFGSAYDGNSYKIEDVNITSGAFTVGLFGVTAGANMNNIILYSENNAKIERNAKADSTSGAYSLGGLIGVAYDYNGVANNAIENCAIAGYRIVDNSKNQQTLGEANVGGLIGVCNGNLKKCSAVTEIEINCTHTANGSYTQAKYGNFLRVGGLTGATLGSLTDCYTGGSISVGAQTLTENVDTSGSFVGNNEGRVVSVSGNKDDKDNPRASSTSIYIAGVGGSGFAQNYKNFSNQDGLREGNPSFKNCYTYMEFPKLEGTIRSITLIGSVADRYANGAKVSIENCYYLDAIVNEAEMLSNVPAFHYNDKVLSIRDTLTANENYYFKEMLQGTGRCEYKLFKNKTDSDSNCVTTLQLTPKSLEGLSDLSITGWSRVTTVENGAAINGKYSFPGSDHQLDGRNYPFPAIVTQTSDATGGPVHVHYGRWPKGNGLYSDRSNITLDLLIPNADSTEVTLTNYSDYNQVPITAENVTFSFNELAAEDTEAKDVDVSTLVQVEAATNADGTVKLNILGLREGTTTITASCGGYQAKIQVTVTAEFSIEATPVKVTLAEDGTVTEVQDVENPDAVPTAFQQDTLYWKLTAANSEDPAQPVELDLYNWKVENADENFDDYNFVKSEAGDILLCYRSNKVGTHSIQVTAYNVPGVNAQTVTGTRSREIRFEITVNPPSVNIFRTPQEMETSQFFMTLYQLPVTVDGVQTYGYFYDKQGKIPITDNTVAPPEEVPAGYEVFYGYVLPVDDPANAKDEDFTRFTDAKGVIVYNQLIDNPEKSLTVYGRWQTLSYDAVFKTGYDDVLISGTEDAQSTVTYTIRDSLAIPTVTPEEIEEGGRNKVFSCWKVAKSDAPTSWTVGDKYTAGASVDAGMFGNVEFEAVWNARYSIRYFAEDGTTEYTEATNTTYVGDASEIALFEPAAPEGSDQRFIGWTVKEPSTALTGWSTEALYRNPIAAASGVSYTGDVELVAHWGNSYPITYYNGDAVFKTDRYIVGTDYTFPDGPEAAAGYRFGGWKVKQAEENTSWTVGDVYQANDTITIGLSDYQGEVLLTAEWVKDTYTLTFDLAGGKTDGDLEAIEPISYQMGNPETLTLPAAPTKEECTFDGWLVTEADAKGFWQKGVSYDAGQVLTTADGVYGSAKLTAKWNEAQYTVRYDPNGGTMDLKPVDGVYMTRYTKSTGVTLANAARGGYTLNGWRQDTPATNQTFGNKLWPAGDLHTGVSGDVNMKAEWIPTPYTITYVDAAGNKLKDASYTIESPVTLEPLPQKNGYNITGWKVVKSDVPEKWVPDAIYGTDSNLTGFYGNVTLAYTQEAISYTITYLDKDGNALSDITRDYTVEDTDKIVIAAEPAAPEFTDNYAHFFTGWKVTNADETGSWKKDDVYKPGQELNAADCYGSASLTAQYSLRSLMLSANSAGTAQVCHVKKDYAGDSFGTYFAEAYTQPQRSGWTLTGWYTTADKNGQKVLNADGTVAENVAGYTSDGKFALTGNRTLYARWTRNVQLFTPVTSLTNGSNVVIGAKVGEDLKVLTMNGTDVSTASISNKDASGYYYLDQGINTSNMVWTCQIYGDYYFTGSNNYYLGREWYGSLTVTNNWQFAAWSVSNNTISHYDRWSNSTQYLTIDNSGVSLSTSPCTLSFFTISNTEAVEYD